jgi:hypothetical protein
MEIQGFPEIRTGDLQLKAKRLAGTWVNKEDLTVVLENRRRSSMFRLFTFVYHSIFIYFIPEPYVAVSHSAIG